MGFDLRDLEVFTVLAREGSFGRAAGALLMSQPSVSSRVRSLERSAGTRLVLRAASGSTLTPAGEALLPYATRCLALSEEGRSAALAADGAPRLRIAAHSSHAPRIMPLVLATLGSTPRRVSIHDAHSEQVPALLLDGVADLGFLLPGPLPSGLRGVRLRPERVFYVVASDHPLAKRRKLLIADLIEAFFAVASWGDSADDFLGLLDQAGVPQWQIRTCSDAGTAVMLARSDRHIAAVAASNVQLDLEAGTLHRLPIRLPPWKVGLMLAHRANADATIWGIAAAARSSR